MVAAILLCTLLAVGAIQSALALSIPPKTSKNSVRPSSRFSSVSASNQTYLDLEVYTPKQSYYDNETTASFTVNTLVNYKLRGDPFSNRTFVPGRHDAVPFTTMRIQITNSLDSTTLVPWSNITINSLGNEFNFNLSHLAPQGSPYPVNIMGVSPDGIQSFYATSAVTVLSSRNLTESEKHVQLI